MRLYKMKKVTVRNSGKVDEAIILVSLAEKRTLLNTVIVGNPYETYKLIYYIAL